VQSSTTTTIWALVTGLAVGFAVGREWPRKDTAQTQAAAPRSTAAATPGAPEGPTEIPASWIKEAEMGATEAFAGLSPAQRYTALKVLNELPCDCGCPHGSVALCKKVDPECPRAPVVIAAAAAAARGGGSYDQVLAAARKRDDAPAQAQAQAAPAEPPQRVELARWTPIKGAATAPVTIVAFSDFQCPYCARATETLRQIEATYGKEVRLAFRHQPLAFHAHAMEAAEASMAAHAQGKFWEMHDKLFANQQALDRAALDRYAKEIGLDLQRYKADMDGHKHRDAIQADSRRGQEVGASGTPTFFINGQQLGGARSLASFRVIIDAELKKAKELLKQGIKPDKIYEESLSRLPIK
jgi:protein-disulfide isomerase